MAQYALDTDTLTLFRQGHPAVAARVTGTPAGDVGTTAITVDEQLAGRYAYLRRAVRPDQIERAYALLVDTVIGLSRFKILPYTQAAIARYQHLLARKLNVGKNDLRIAAIALECGAVVATRNVRDFARVPGLAVEDWSLTHPRPRPGRRSELIQQTDQWREGGVRPRPVPG